MKVLLDENLPHALRGALALHDVQTVAYAGWSGVRNGQLLAFAEGGGFDVFLTADRNLSYQQNLKERKISLVVLTEQQWPLLAPHVERILEAIAQSGSESFVVIDCTLRNSALSPEIGL